VSAVPLSDTLTSDIIPTSARLWNPRTLEIVGSEYLLVFDDVDNGSIIKVFSIPELKFLYGWGSIGGGPNELQRFPSFHSINTKGDTLILLDAPSPGVQRLDYYMVTDTTMQLVDEKKISYEGQKSLINNLQRLNDSLYIADYGMRVESDDEHIAFDPDKNGLKFTFGGYPKPGIPKMKRYRMFIKRNDSSERLRKFVSFYMRYDRFKIYNFDGIIVSNVLVKDEMPSQPVKGAHEDFVHTMWVEAEGPFIFSVVMARRASLIDASKFSQMYPFLEVWNWNGEQVKRYPLDVSTNSIAISGQHEQAYTYQIGVDSLLYKYSLDDIAW
jgi:hypothetical protein